MRIAIISTMSLIPWGGSEELWAAMADEALNEGHEVVILYYDWPTTPSKIASLCRRGARILKRPLPRPRSLKQRIFARLRTSTPFVPPPPSEYQAIFDLKPDVICISHGGAYDCAYELALLKLLYASSAPYVIVNQYLDANYIYIFHETLRDRSRELYARAACVAFVSQQNAAVAERQLARPIPQAVVLRNPINLSDLTVVPWPSSRSVNLASVARLAAAHKGQDILFETLGAPMWRERDWQLRLYGEGPDRKYLEELAHYFGIAERVKFVGHVNDVRGVWGENHLLVLPSRAEGTPLALVEAMICGRPSVVTDVGGNTEWVEEMRTGFVAEAFTARSFGAALERAWLARDRWEQIGLQAHEQALIKFDRSPGSSLLRVLLDVVHQPRVSPIDVQLTGKSFEIASVR